MKIFQWRVVVCDDFPNLPEIIDTKLLLEEMGCEVLVVSTVDDFLASASQLAKCHLAFVDMKWDGVFSRDSELKSIPTQDSFEVNNPRAFVEAWIDAISSFGCERKIQIEAGEGWPRDWIDHSSMGAWIGALLTIISPGIEIVFYSGKPEIVSTGLAAALGRFRDPVFAVETKSGRGDLPKGTIKARFRKLQQRALGRIDIFHWFLASVLLPKLLGAKTARQVLMGPTCHDFRRADGNYSFDAQAFFLACDEDEDALTVDVVKEFFHQSPPLRVSIDLLAKAEHDLRPWKFRDACFERADVTTQLTRISQIILTVLPNASSIAGMLWAAVESLRLEYPNARDICLASITRAWELIWATLHEPNCEFNRLAEHFAGRLISCTENRTFPPDEHEAELRKSRAAAVGKIARVDLVGLEMCCGQLKANGDGKLHVNDLEHFVIVTWCGTWENPPEFEGFKKLVERSLLKPNGPYRGLPSVVLFGLANRAQSMRVYLGTEWHSLFGEAHSGALKEELASPYRFEWVFHKE